MAVRRSKIGYVEGDLITPSNVGKKQVEQYAVQVATLTEFRPGGDLTEMVALLGGRIHYQPIDDWFDEDGSIFVHGKDDFDILLPQYTSPLRDRFTIAHELGHYFLHSDQGNRPIIAYRRGSTRIEWEANWFAAGLLMPHLEFRSLCDAGWNVDQLAAHFFVSEQAATVRRNAIGH